MKYQSSTEYQIKICFIMPKKVKYGQAIYAVGNIYQLGNWNISSSLRLTWNKEDYWTGFFTLSSLYGSNIIEFKYVIAQWEVGTNRKIEVQPLKLHIICDSRWNKQRMSLNLLTEDSLSPKDYYIIGNCMQLGSWAIFKKMFEIQNAIPRSIKQQNKFKQEQLQKCYNYTFQIYRGNKSIHYYYMRHSQFTQIERNPGRKYEIQLDKSYHSNTLKITHKSGDTAIYDNCNFDELNYSKINESIYIGAYIRDLQDVRNLNSQGITSIISIQTDQDFSFHSISQLYIRKLCQINGLQYHSLSIQDMNKGDFINKSSQGLKLLKKLLEEKKKIYVHCSAGFFDLLIYESLSIEQAIRFIKQKHPFARPSIPVIKQALLKLKMQNHELAHNC